MVDLLTAGNYAILTKTGISTVPTSNITGDIAVSPAAAASMTGFSLSLDSTGEFSTSTQVMGKAWAANYASPTPGVLTSAVSAMEAAYTNAANRVNTNTERIDLGAGLLGGTFGGPGYELTTGIYTFNSDVTLTSDIYFSGSSTDIFIIQIAGNLVQAANMNVILSGGALAENIFWQIAGHVSVGEGAHMEGILLVMTYVLFKTTSSLNGRILAQTACNLQVATITQPSV
jgi:hypothetical protein